MKLIFAVSLPVTEPIMPLQVQLDFSSLPTAYISAVKEEIRHLGPCSTTLQGKLATTAGHCALCKTVRVAMV